VLPYFIYVTLLMYLSDVTLCYKCYTMHVTFLCYTTLVTFSCFIDVVFCPVLVLLFCHGVVLCQILYCWSVICDVLWSFSLENVVIASKEEKEQKRRQQVKAMKKKYGLQVGALFSSSSQRWFHLRWLLHCLQQQDAAFFLYNLSPWMDYSVSGTTDESSGMEEWVWRYLNQIWKKIPRNKAA